MEIFKSIEFNNFKLFKLFFYMVLICISIPEVSYGEELDKKLSYFESILNSEWEGKLRNIDIKWTMESTLKGKVVRRKLDAPKAGISSEMTIYWDPSEKQIKFIRISSRGFILRGNVEISNNKFILEGVQIKNEEISNFKNEFEIINDNKMIDIWYDEKGKIGHKIEYIRKQ